MGANELKKELENTQKLFSEIAKLSFAGEKTGAKKVLDFHALKREQLLKTLEKSLNSCKTFVRDISDENVKALFQTFIESKDVEIIPHILEALQRVKIAPLTKN